MISECGLASQLPAPYIVPPLLLLLFQRRLEYLISETARGYNNTGSTITELAHKYSRVTIKTCIIWRQLLFHYNYSTLFKHDSDRKYAVTVLSPTEFDDHKDLCMC
jgi:hypothetical protein